MPEKTDVLTGPQIQYEYFVALNKVETIEKSMGGDWPPETVKWYQTRLGELRRWMDSLKDEYIRRGENPGDIPF